MIFFCADDYGISSLSNKRIENCLKNGILNKVSVLPNGEMEDFKNRLSDSNTTLSLHINLIEGRPLSDSKDVGLLTGDDGYFRYSFSGLFFLSVSSKRKKLKKQLYTEIQNQIKFWKMTMGENTSFSIDAHQHTHLIPLVFKTLMEVIRDEGIVVDNIRIPDEPVTPYIFTPSLYFDYSFIGLIKQWVLKLFTFANRKELKKSKINPAYFMGVMFSGKLNEKRIKKLLPGYLKLANKYNKNIEIGFHPGYAKSEEDLIEGAREDFKKFYYSPWRKKEYDTLLNFKL